MVVVGGVTTSVSGISGLVDHYRVTETGRCKCLYFFQICLLVHLTVDLDAIGTHKSYLGKSAAPPETTTLLRADHDR